MLSKTERIYLSSIERFEDETSISGAKVIRSRLRKKIKLVFNDLKEVIVSDGKGRMPTRNWRERTNAQDRRKPNPRDLDKQIILFREQLNMRHKKGRVEERMINPYAFKDLVCAFVNANPQYTSMIKEAIDKA